MGGLGWVVILAGPGQCQQPLQQLLGQSSHLNSRRGHSAGLPVESKFEVSTIYDIPLKISLYIMLMPRGSFSPRNVDGHDVSIFSEALARFCKSNIVRDRPKAYEFVGSPGAPLEGVFRAHL